MSPGSRGRDRRADAVVGRAYRLGARVRSKALRAQAIGIARARAAARDATIELAIDPAVQFLGHVDIDVWPGTTNRVDIGPGTRLHEGVHLSMRGGSLRIGSGCDIRRWAYAHVTGDLVVGDGVVLSQGMGVHAQEHVCIGTDTIIGHGSTIADSSHVRTPADRPIWHETTSSPVHVGRNIWMGANVVITPGVRVGDCSIVAANSVVVDEVEPWSLMAGVPAKRIRTLEPVTSAS